MAIDLISRQAAIDAIGKKSDEIYKTKQKGATYPHDDFFQGMAYAENVVEQMPSAQPEQQWILCSERLPTKPGRYLVTQKNPYGMRVTIAYFDWNEFWDEAVAWMPLPEPYKENKDASI